MARSVEVLSRWHHSAEGFSFSPLEFFGLVEDELREHMPPEVLIERIVWSEGGLASARREYLRIGYGRFAFDICAAPFGTGFFWSWWLVKRKPSASALLGCLGIVVLPLVLYGFTKAFGIVQGFFLFLFALAFTFALARQALGEESGVIEDAVLAIPVVGPYYERTFKPATYFTEDTRLMFEESVKRAVERVVNACLTRQGLRALGPAVSGASRGAEVV